MIKRIALIALLFFWTATVFAANSINNINNTNIEKFLSPFQIGESKDSVVKKLGGPLTGTVKEISFDIIFKDNWTAFIDLTKSTLKGISFDEPRNIKNGYPYPKTSKAITIGSTLSEVEKVYGTPNTTFSGRSPYVLRTSELYLIYEYSNIGIWVTFVNLTPYSGKEDWRVNSILIGDEDVLEHMETGVPAYAVRTMTSDKKRSIIAAYEKKYGIESDLEIFDDYMYAVQNTLFNYVKSIGDYIITPIMVLPKDDEKIKEFNGKLSDDSSLSKKLESESKIITATSHKISLTQMDRIIEKVAKFKDELFYEEASENNAEMQRRLEQKEKSLRFNQQRVTKP